MSDVQTGTVTTRSRSATSRSWPRYFHVTTNPGYYFAVIAVGNLFGPLLLGRAVRHGRPQPMIAGTYLASGLILLLTAYVFDQGALNATTMTAAR